jgi:hypothetical protein
MERSDFLSALRESSKGVHGFLSADGRGWLASMIAGKKEGSTDDIDTDRIFELICYFTLLGCLSGEVGDLQLIPGDGQNGYRFPLAPGNKSNFAFFRFHRDDAVFDICCGTGLPDRDGTTVYPDISLQRGSWPNAADKSVGEVMAIWDGKFHEAGFSKDDLYQMNWWFDVLELPRCATGDILEQLFPEGLRVCAVITNAPPVAVNHAHLIRKGFSVIFDFSGVGPYTAVPTRAQHLGASPSPRPRKLPIPFRRSIDFSIE